MYVKKIALISGLVVSGIAVSSGFSSANAAIAQFAATFTALPACGGAPIFCAGSGTSDFKFGTPVAGSASNEFSFVGNMIDPNNLPAAGTPINVGTLTVFNGITYQNSNPGISVPCPAGICGGAVPSTITSMNFVVTLPGTAKQGTVLLAYASTLNSSNTPNDFVYFPTMQNLGAFPPGGIPENGLQQYNVLMIDPSNTLTFDCLEAVGTNSCAIGDPLIGYTDTSGDALNGDFIAESDQAVPEPSTILGSITGLVFLGTAASVGKRKKASEEK
jgi:hypothetical protein